MPEVRHGRGNWTVYRFVGLRNAKIIVANPATFVGLGNFSDAQVQIATFGLIVTAILMARKIGGAILIGIVVATIAGICRGLSQWPSHIFSLPHPGGTLLKLDFAGAARLDLRGADLCFLLRGFIRQRRHSCGRLRTRRLHARWQAAARQPRPARRCNRHDVRRADRHVDSYELH